MIQNEHPEDPDEVAIHINGMNKWFGTFHVLREIDLTVYRGERIVVCGPSGSGKSTLIRCINALEEHQTGQIIVDGTELTSDIKNIDKIRSEVGMCFQHFNLFPHLIVHRLDHSYLFLLHAFNFQFLLLVVFLIP